MASIRLGLMQDACYIYTYIGPCVCNLHSVPSIAVTVSFAHDKYYFKEDDVRGIVVLKASGDTSQPFTVVVHSTDGTATGGCMHCRRLHQVFKCYALFCRGCRLSWEGVCGEI